MPYHWLSVYTPAGPGKAGASRCWHARAPPSRPGLAGQRDRPSIPAVLRPALRCVACRTLTSVLLQLRNISFCKFLGQRPVCLLNRLEDPPAQPPYPLLMAPPVRMLPGVTIEQGQALRSVHKVSNVPVSSGIYARFASKADLELRQLPYGTRAPGPVSSRLLSAMRRTPGHHSAAFLLPFGRRPSLLSHPVPPGTSAPLTVGLPPHLRIPAPARRTLTRFPRSARMRPGPGRAPSLPRGQRCLPATKYARPPPAASQRPVPATPENTQPGMLT